MQQAEQQTCVICNGAQQPAFDATVLGRYPVTYWFCPACEHLRAPSPHWLKEAYAEAISRADTGLVARNLDLSRKLACVLFEFFDRDGCYLDIAGGVGLLTRLMRDIGFHYYWEDPYCSNALAPGFEAPRTDLQFEAVTAFEVMEHVTDPLEFVRGAVARSATGTLIFTTELFQDRPPPADWWYYAFPTGQHISFYTLRTLTEISRRLNLHFSTAHGLHLFSRRQIPQARLEHVLRSSGRGLFRKVTAQLTSLTESDHQTMLHGGPYVASRPSTPVALFIFNRPQTTNQVFDAIAKAKPPVLLVVADGPRSDRSGEDAACRQARAVVDRVDWDCDVRTNFAERNLGCRARISSGLDWVFSEVEEAIILEDDCLPDPSFYPYCQELLSRYRDDPRVMMISGDQFLHRSFRDSYYFSRYSHIWGWATWRRAWRRYDLAISEWPRRRDAGWLEQKFAAAGERDHWRGIFDAVHAGQIDTWDYQWTFACFVHGGLSAVPAVNLISNIGFGAGATHTTGSEDGHASLLSHALRFPLRHPRATAADLAADAEEFRLLAGRRPVWAKLQRSLQKRLKKISALARV